MSYTESPPPTYSFWPHPGSMCRHLDASCSRMRSQGYGRPMPPGAIRCLSPTAFSRLLKSWGYAHASSPLTRRRIRFSRSDARWHGGVIHPVANRPDGVTWTGFVSETADYSWDDVGGCGAFDRYFLHETRGNVRERPCTVVAARHRGDAAAPPPFARGEARGTDALF